MSISRVRKARKPHTCTRNFCQIEPGQQYVESVAFASDDYHGGGPPWRVRTCLGCSRREAQR